MAIQEMMAVMLAFSMGETVQIKMKGSEDHYFDDIFNPKWDWYNYTYRVKPAEPREYWVNEYPSGERYIYQDEQKAAFCCCLPAETVHVIEVLDKE